ncbi:MAG: hypothetical protein HS111_30650 [Kofleriaceae bacterium]|nr:hypothetical protein [Kofleriaceae bacterium]
MAFLVEEVVARADRAKAREGQRATSRTDAAAERGRARRAPPAPPWRRQRASPPATVWALIDEFQDCPTRCSGEIFAGVAGRRPPDLRLLMRRRSAPSKRSALPRRRVHTYLRATASWTALRGGGLDRRASARSRGGRLPRAAQRRLSDARPVFAGDMRYEPPDDRRRRKRLPTCHRRPAAWRAVRSWAASPWLRFALRAAVAALLVRGSPRPPPRSPACWAYSPPASPAPAPRLPGRRRPGVGHPGR